MNNKKISQDKFMLLYYENKEYLIPVVAIAISLVLFFVFLFPQILSFPGRKQAIDVENEVLRKVQETERIVLSQNSSNLDDKIKIVSNALPPGKNFEQILNGISTAAALSGTQIENYRFENLQNETAEITKYSVLEFKVSIIGDAREAIGFIKELYKTYPVSDVTSISSQENITVLTVKFFYKPFPSAGGEDRTSIKELTAQQVQALSEATKWNNGSIGSAIDIDIEASSSGEVRTSPF